MPGLRANVAALLVQGVEGGALPVVARVATEESVSVDGGDGLRVPVVVEVAGSPLLELAEAREAREELRVEMYVYALDATNAVVAHLSRLLEIDVERFGEVVTRAGIRFVDAIDLPPGRYSFRFLVVNPESRAFGLVIRAAELEPPENQAGGSWEGSPQILSRCAPWLVAEAASRLDATGSSNRWTRVESVDNRPVVIAGSTVRLQAVRRGRAAADAAREAIEVLLTGDDSQPLRLPVKSEHLSRPEIGGRRYELEIELPEVAEGQYEISVRSIDRTTSEETGPEPLEVWLSAERAGEPCPTWASLRRNFLLANTEASTGLATPRQRGSRRRLRELSEQYSGVLDLLGVASDPAAALQRLLEIESSFLQGDDGQIEDLAAVQLTSLQELFDLDAESVLPPLMLHHQAYEAHYQSRRYGLAGHSRRIVGSMADWMLDEKRRFRSLGTLADLLTSLADYAERHLMVFESQALLRRVLEAQPEHESARLLLAMSYERVGFQERASRELDILISGNSGLQEARLRRAIIAMRSGDVGDAIPRLRRLTRERPDPWILALAYQTLAASLGRVGREEEAVATLEQAVGLFPSDQRLQLQLAHWLDRAGERQRAHAVIQSLPIDGEAVEASNRLRYTERGISHVESLRDSLLAAIAVRLPRLRAALRRSGDEVSR